MNRMGKLFPELDLDSYLSLVDNRVSLVLAEPKSSFTALLENIASGGKRLRPTLLLACSRGRNVPSSDDRLVHSGAAVELLHLASLVHDDILDGADRRRQMPSLNAAHGTVTALLCGDYLLALAFAEAARVSSHVALDMANCMGTMCEAGNVELANTWRLEVSTEDALRLIEQKTAQFFRFCCELGATIAELRPDVRDALGEFGFNFGIGFQLLDDLEDFYTADSVDSDLRQGNFTFPVRAAIGGPTGDELAQLLANQASGEVSRIVKLIAEGGGFDAALGVIDQRVALATSALGDVPSDLPVDGLSAMLSLVKNRSEAAVRSLTESSSQAFGSSRGIAW